MGAYWGERIFQPSLGRKTDGRHTGLNRAAMRSSHSLRCADFHAPHWHGNTVIVNGMRTDVTQLAMMQMATADVVPDNVGTWLFHCHVACGSASS
jgi:hypothetical protein